MVAASKEVEWIRNLLLDIKLWLQSISIIFLYCDNEATMSELTVISNGVLASFYVEMLKLIKHFFNII